MSLRRSSVFPEFSDFLERFAGRTIASVWFSDHSVMYLELGRVIGVYRSGRPEHEYGAFLGFDWRLTLPSGRVEDRSAREERTVERYLSARVIATVQLSETRELQLDFADGGRLESRCDPGGTPEWSLRESSAPMSTRTRGRVDQHALIEAH